MSIELVSRTEVETVRPTVDESVLPTVRVVTSGDGSEDVVGDWDSSPTVGAVLVSSVTEMALSSEVVGCKDDVTLVPVPYDVSITVVLSSDVVTGIDVNCGTANVLAEYSTGVVSFAGVAGAVVVFGVVVVVGDDVIVDNVVKTGTVVIGNSEVADVDVVVVDISSSGNVTSNVVVADDVVA